MEQKPKNTSLVSVRKLCEADRFASPQQACSWSYTEFINDFLTSSYRESRTVDGSRRLTVTSPWQIQQALTWQNYNNGSQLSKELSSIIRVGVSRHPIKLLDHPRSSSSPANILPLLDTTYTMRTIIILKTFCITQQNLRKGTRSPSCVKSSIEQHKNVPRIVNVIRLRCLVYEDPSDNSFRATQEQPPRRQARGQHTLLSDHWIFLDAWSTTLANI